MDNYAELLKNCNAVVKDLHSKIEKAKEYLSEDQKKEFEEKLKKASEDISKAGDVLNDLKARTND